VIRCVSPVFDPDSRSDGSFDRRSLMWARAGLRIDFEFHQSLKRHCPSSLRKPCQRRTKIALLGVRTFSWTVYATSPRLARYSTGLKPPSESLIRFSLYHRMYSSTSLMNCFTVVFRQFRL
jgi:hypothetical protein